MWEILTVDGKISTLDEKRAIFRIILRNLLQFLNQIPEYGQEEGQVQAEAKEMESAYGLPRKQ